MVAASKLRTQAIRAYERREANENALTQTNQSFEVFLQYISAERRQKAPHLQILQTLYERAIAEAAKKLFKGDADLGLTVGDARTELALQVFWAGLCDSLVS